jgi:translocation and assembly module TamB
VDARVETEGQQILAESDWSRGGASRLHTRAFLPRDLVFAQPGSLLQHPRTRIEAQLQEFDLAALAAFLPSEVSKIGGVVDARVEARGGPERPELSGTLALEGGTLALAALRQRPLEPMSARLRFDNDRIFLQQLTIGSAEAGVSAQGEAQIESDQVASVDLGVAFEKFPIDARGLVRGTLSGPIRISGKPRALALTGELELADLKIEIPEEDDATVKEIRVISGDGTTPGLTIQEDETETSIIDPMRVDLELRIARNSWARGRGAEVELQGSLRAKKTRKTAIRLDGTIETVRGTYEIYGRRFRIERGEAVLDGAEDPDPVLNARALHRVRGVRIYAILEGRLSDPRLRFESQPELTETDIASYLLLGRPASGDEGPPPALDAVAAQVATGAAVREFERLLGGTLPVDLLDARMEKNGDTSELRAGVGKYVGDRLFLHYERGFGDEPEDELQAEYELDDNWSIESSVSSEGQTSAHLIFEIEY